MGNTTPIKKKKNPYLKSPILLQDSILSNCIYRQFKQDFTLSYYFSSSESLFTPSFEDAVIPIILIDTFLDSTIPIIPLTVLWNNYNLYASYRISRWNISIPEC
jgi:hypothetical protein